jgi:hypothetical protein
MTQTEMAAAEATAKTHNDMAKVRFSPDMIKYLESFLLESLKKNGKLTAACNDIDIQDIVEYTVDTITAQQVQADAESMQADADAMLGVSAADLLARDVTATPTLYDPILPLGVVGVLAGESDANKSMLLRQLAICTATGRDFLGYEYTGKRQSAIYVATEDDENSTAFFLKRNNETFNDPPQEWRNLRFLFGADDVQRRLEEILSAHPADLVIIDSLPDVFDGKDTNNMAQMRAFLKPFTKLAREHQCLVLFLHHVGKGRENQAPNKNLLNGSQAIEAAARCVFLLLKDKAEDNLRHLCVVKHNYLPAEYKKESQVLTVDPRTFTFASTGMHTPLGMVNDETSVNKKTMSDYGTDNELKAVFAQITSPSISRTELMKRVRNSLSTGQNKAYDLIDYAAFKKWISATTNGNVTRYVSTLPF